MTIIRLKFESLILIVNMIFNIALRSLWNQRVYPLVKASNICCLSILITALPTICSLGQESRKIYTQDIDNFWIAYDSVVATGNREKQETFIKKLYLDNATEGLKAFAKNKENLESKWVSLILQNRVFWDSLRPKSIEVKKQVEQLEKSILRLQGIYPDLRAASTYFIIGLRQQGGTIRNNISIIGSEVILSEPTYNEDNLKYILAHEYVHTQQTKPDFRSINVLTSSIREGACDFISELVLNQKLNLPYIKYGESNEVSVWKIFNQDMLSSANNFWVSTGSNPNLPVSDLGYFIGYAICKSYYQSSKNKTQAIKEIIEIEYQSQEAVYQFLKKSNYEKYIASKGFNSDQKLPIEGYRLVKGDVLFEFDLKKQNVILDEKGIALVYREKDFGKIETVNVVGEFNNWNVNDYQFQMSKTPKETYILKVDRSKLGSQTKFKFVINGKYWVQPNFAISNRRTEQDGNTNLTIQL